MPITPLHYVFAYLFYHLGNKKLNFPVLIISSMVSDLEVPIIYLFSNGSIDRLMLHSIFGGLIIGIPLSILVILPLYKLFFLKIFGVKQKNFSNSNSLILFFSAVLGILSHILLDSIQHPFNPLFWPFSMVSFNDAILFNNLIIASNFLFILFSVALLLIFIFSIFNQKSLIIQLFIK